MAATYGIRVVHRGRGADVASLRQAVAQELESIGLHRSVSVAVADSELPQGIPHICVCLCDTDSKSDSSVNEDIREELESGTTIFPVVEDLALFSQLVPEQLTFANGITWQDDASLQRLVRVLLEELGIEEQQRRVFISHRRTDGLGVAEQLHDHLSHFKFQPFIDRFAIREGTDFQQEISRALEDHAFLLLLETFDAHNSDWVFDEVDYALSHAMGILIVRWPGDVREVPGSGGLPRHILGDDEVTTDDHGYSILTDGGLDRLLEAIESAHARGLVRRRRLLLESVREAAVAAGVDSCVSLRDWKLLIGTPAGLSVVGTSPRLPTAVDLQAVDEASVQANADLPGVLVHSARALPTELRRHLEWVSHTRSMRVIPENAVGGWWIDGH